VTSPLPGSTVDSPFVVRGQSDTFEATVNWSVSQGRQVIKEGVTQGGSYGQARPFRFAIRLPNGTYTVRVFEYSAEDGRPMHMVAIPIEVRESSAAR
jgi:hypothetical protein